MNANEHIQIDIEAALALAKWKSRFADEVCERAKQFAAESGHPESVTVSHYRQAAHVALRSLSDAIHDEDELDGQQQAA